MEDSLKQKLSRLAEQCAYVRKEGRNEFHKYNYASAAQIFEKVNEGLQDHGLVSMPYFAIHEITTRAYSKGGTETLATVECTLRIEDLEIQLRPRGRGQYRQGDMVACLTKLDQRTVYGFASLPDRLQPEGCPSL